MPISTAVNPNANWFNPGGGGAQGATAPSTTVPVASLSSPAPTPLAIPPAPTPTNTQSINSSIPTPESIINQSTQQAPAEQQQASILGSISQLQQNNASLTTLQQQTEGSAGIAGLTKTYNDLGAQLQGLNDQATSLQNDAMSGGKIQNQETNDAIGRRSASQASGLMSSDLRNNQIQQATIASQALTVKSALYYAQNNLTLAKDAADKAAQVQFDAQQQQITYQKSLLDAIAPQLNKEEKAQAALQQAQLADRQTQIDQQKQDYVAGIGLVNNAMKLNGQNPAAQLAIQAAQALDKNDPQYLQKVGQLLSKYQQDPIATQQALAQLDYTRSEAAKNYADAKKVADFATAAGQDPTVVNGWVSAIKTGNGKLSDLTGDPALKNAVVAALNVGGNSTTDILKTTKTSLDELNSMVTNNNGFTAAVGLKGIMSNPLGSLSFGAFGKPIPGSPAADFDAKLTQAKNDVILPNLNLLHGLGRVTDREFQALSSAVTALSTDQSETAFKASLKDITDQINEKMNTMGLDKGQGSTVTVQGQQFSVGTVYQDAKGNTGTFDANGKWTPQ